MEYSYVLYNEPSLAASAGFSDYMSRNYRFELPILLVNASSSRFIFAVSTNKHDLWSAWSGSSG